MKNFAIATGIAGALASATVGLAGAAVAAPAGPGSAGDVVNNLQDQGYNVMLNGSRSGPLSDCIVTGIHNPDASGQVKPAQFTTVYVDVSCPPSNN